MGNSQSSPSNNEARRSNRLSKPLTQKLSLNTSSPQETNSPELASGLIGWENPWVGSQISEASSSTQKTHAKAREVPPTLFESDEPAGDAAADYDRAMFAQRFDQHSFGVRPEYQTASTGNRRASYHPGTFGDTSSSQLSSVPEQPQRANSLQVSALQRSKSTMYENVIEEAASSNTHFLVGNQRFSLTRRRSLLTRPGVATRRTTSAVRRMPSPIGEPESPTDDLSHVLQWPLPPRQRHALAVAPPARPSSPADSRYTQLGALKLGSLRVVNGSSPCPSERIPLNGSHATSAGLGLQHVDTSNLRRPALKMTLGHDAKSADDIPGSPFSYEKSPIITVQPRSKAMFQSEPEDEGVGICDDAATSSSSNSQPDKSVMVKSMGRQPSQSLNKSDSGYSSAASISSFQQSRPRVSFDSQQSGSRSAERERHAWTMTDLAVGQSVNRLQRHMSLQETKRGQDGRLHAAVPLWNESSKNSSRPSSSGLPSRRSTCAGRYVEYPTQRDYSPGVFVPHHAGPTRASVYADRFPSLMNVGYDPRYYYPETTTGARVNYSRMRNPEPANRPHRSASEHLSTTPAYNSYASSSSRSQSRSRRVWSLKPGADIPPLPTILSPDHLQAEENKDLDWFESSRGRPRSRSHDRCRRKLTKPRRNADIHCTSSPFALH